MSIPASPEQRLNPFPFYAQMRSSAPVAWIEPARSWGVFRYDDVRAVLGAPAVFSSEIGHLIPGRNKEKNSLVFSDPPRHTRLRALVSRAFSPQAIAPLEARIRALAGALLDAAAPRGEMDLIADLAGPLPLIVIAELLGARLEDHERFRRWSEAVMTLVNQAVGAEGHAAFLQSQQELHDYLRGIIAQRRAEPADDLISKLVSAEIDGERLDEQDLLLFCNLLLVAGNETTANLIGNAVISLLDHPGELERLRADVSLVPSTIEEVLRYRGPVQSLLRVVKEDTELGGKTLRAGERVLAFLGSANRDEGTFAAPDRFDIGRDPNPHIGFGLGIHFCVGAALARLEARIALKALLERLPDLARADGAPLEPVPGATLHGVKRLPVRFRAAR